MNRNLIKRRNSLIITAIITVVIFAVLLYAFFNPLGFYNTTHPAAAFDTSQDFIRFFDVGQGDCALIYSNGYSAIIDVGMPDTANSIAEDLYDCNITELDALVISHLHSDHVGALPEFVKNIKIQNLIRPVVFDKSIAVAKNGKNSAIKNGTKYYDAKQGMNFNIGEFEITLLSDFEDKSNENNRSLFIIAKIGDVKILFTGDAEAKMESKLLDENLNIDCDILKVSHHGSNTSTTQEFIDATTPEYAVISVGENNIYNHPHSQTLNRLKKADAEILRTDQNGDVTFYIENNHIAVEKEQ